jgi:hypothetical protein
MAVAARMDPAALGAGGPQGPALLSVGVPAPGSTREITAMMAVAARMDPAACQPAGHEGPPYQ